MVPDTIKGFARVDPFGAATRRERIANPATATVRPAYARYSDIGVEGFASNMAIPGYDSSTVDEFTLEHAGARVAIVAGVVPDEFGLEKSVREPPVDALAEPVKLVGIDGVKAVEAMRIGLVYDPSKLPPGASPTDVAVAVETNDGWEPLESTVDLEETTVTAILNDRPPGSTVVAGYDDSGGQTP